MRSSHSRETGFTLVEVLAAAAVLSLLVLCTVRLGAVYGRMTGDLLLRQKAVFAIDGEMERLAALYATTGFGAVNGGQSTVYPPLSPIPNSSIRTVYFAGSTLAPFVTTSASTFLQADTYVWSVGAGTLTTNYVWLDRGRNAMARMSWILCPISASAIASCWGGQAGGGRGPPGAFNCYDPAGLGGSGTCQLLTLVLEFPYWLQNGAAVAGTNLSTMTLNTIVGRRR